jgi:hypothetical protein
VYLGAELLILLHELCTSELVHVGVYPLSSAPRRMQETSLLRNCSFVQYSRIDLYDPQFPQNLRILRWLCMVGGLYHKGPLDRFRPVTPLAQVVVEHPPM